MSKLLAGRRAGILLAAVGALSLSLSLSLHPASALDGAAGAEGLEGKVAPSVKIDPKALEEKAAQAPTPRSVVLLTVLLLQDQKETDEAISRDKLDVFVKSVQQTAEAYFNSETRFDTKQLIIRCTITPDGHQNFSMTSKPGMSGRLTTGLDQALLTVPPAVVKGPVAMEIIFAVADNETKTAAQMRKVIRAGRAEEAVAKLAPMAAIDTNNALVWQTLGWAYSSQGDYVNAEKTLKKALQLDPRDFDSWSNLVSTYHSQGRTKEASAAAQKSLDCAPDDEAVDTVKINSALFEGDWSKAEVILRKRCKASGDAAGPYQVILACALRWQGKNDEAKELLQTALKQEMGDYYTKLATKELALINGDWKTAEELSRKDVGKDPKDYEALYDLGVALKGSGKLDEARKAFESASQPVTPKSIMVLIEAQMKELPRVSTEAGAKTSSN